MTTLQRDSSRRGAGATLCVLGSVFLTAACDGMLHHRELQLSPNPPAPAPASAPMPSQDTSSGVSEDTHGGVFLRVRNDSEVAFDSVVVGWSSEPTDFGPLPVGAYGEYVEVDRAYRYSYVEMTASEGTFVFLPIDFVGEFPLPQGYYTYALVAERYDEPWEWDGKVYDGFVSITVVSEPPPAD